MKCLLNCCFSFDCLPLHSVNFLIIETLERYYYFYGDDLKVECPTGSGNEVTLLQVSHELCRRSVLPPGISSHH